MWPNAPHNPIWDYNNIYRGGGGYSAFNMACRDALSANNSSSFDTGTHFSDRKVSDKVVTTEFDFGHQCGKIEIYYASKRALREMGVPVEQASTVSFPRAFRNEGYCKPPKRKAA